MYSSYICYENWYYITIGVIINYVCVIIMSFNAIINAI